MGDTPDRRQAVQLGSSNEHSSGDNCGQAVVGSPIQLDVAITLAARALRPLKEPTRRIRFLSQTQALTLPRDLAVV